MADQLTNYLTAPNVITAAEKMSVQKNAFIKSGAVVQDSLLATACAAKTDTVKMAWNADLDYTSEPNPMNADPADLAVASTLSGVDSTARIYYHSKSWLIANFVERMAIQADPAGFLATKLSNYKTVWDQKYLLAALRGVIADNVLNDNGDMVIDIYQDIAVPLAANKPSYAALLDTLQTSGDHQDKYSALACHSLTVTNLKKIDPNGFKTVESNVLGLPPVTYYRGMALVIDDDMTVENGANAKEYYTYVLGPAGIGIADAPLPARTQKTAIETVQAAGQGAGAETYFYRWAMCQNPYGFSNLIPSGTPLRLANLSLAASWDRKVDRKLVPIACLIHNN